MIDAPRDSTAEKKLLDDLEELTEQRWDTAFNYEGIALRAIETIEALRDDAATLDALRAEIEAAKDKVAACEVMTTNKQVTTSRCPIADAYNKPQNFMATVVCDWSHEASSFKTVYNEPSPEAAILAAAAQLRAEGDEA